MQKLIYVVACLTMITACSDDEDIDSNESARRAYLGLDGSIEKSIALGFTAFNMATNANITPQTAAGDAGGTLTVSGQVDKGASMNKGMRLNVGMVGYDDGDVEYNEDHDTIHVVYDTSTDLTMQPYLAMQLMNFPNGTLQGTLSSNTTMTGIYKLSGDLEGDLTLDLTIAGTTMQGATVDQVLRVPGTTTITGTATNSDGGTYTINITI